MGFKTPCVWGLHHKGVSRGVRVWEYHAPRIRWGRRRGRRCGPCGSAQRSSCWTAARAWRGGQARLASKAVSGHGVWYARTVDLGCVSRVEIGINRPRDVGDDPEGDLATLTDDAVGDLLSRNNLAQILQGPTHEIGQEVDPTLVGSHIELVELKHSKSHLFVLSWS